MKNPEAIQRLLARSIPESKRRVRHETRAGILLPGDRVVSPSGGRGRVVETRVRDGYSEILVAWDGNPNGNTTDASATWCDAEAFVREENAPAAVNVSTILCDRVRALVEERRIHHERLDAMLHHILDFLDVEDAKNAAPCRWCKKPIGEHTTEQESDCENHWRWHIEASVADDGPYYEDDRED